MPMTDPILSPTSPFCGRPFTHAIVCGNGVLRCCPPQWMEQPLGRIEGDDLDLAWNGPDAAAIRASILDGSFRFCNAEVCPYLILGGDELPERIAVREPLLQRAIRQRLTEVPWGPARLAIADETARTTETPAPETWARLFEKGLDDTVRLVLSPGTEAASRSGLLEALQNFPWDRYLSLTIELQADAYDFTPDLWRKLAPCHKLLGAVEIGLDTAQRTTFRKRHPGKAFWKLMRNLKEISKNRLRGRFSYFTLRFDVDESNFEDMPAVVKLGQWLRADAVRFVPAPSDTDPLGDGIQFPGHPRHTLLRAVLARHVFAAPRVDLGVFAAFRDTGAPGVAPAKTWMAWEKLAETLALDEKQAARIRQELERLNREAAELLGTPTEDGHDAPLAYLAKAKGEMDGPEADQAFEAYLAARVPKGKRESYTAVLRQMERRPRGILARQLNPNQRTAFGHLGVHSLFYVDIGHNALNQAMRQAAGGTESAPKPADLHFDTWVRKLNMHDASVPKVRQAIDRLKNEFTTLFTRPPADGGPSPAAFLARLTVEGEADAEARFVEYAQTHIEPVSGKNYFEAFQTRQIRCYNLLVSLSPKVQRVLNHGDGASLIDVDTGHNPFQDAVRRLELDLRENRDNPNAGDAP